MEGSVVDLSRYRFETAQEDLETAKMLFDAGKWKASLNRSYYAIFHALRSVTALDGFDAKKHSTVIAYFNQWYVKTEIFEKGMTKLIGSAFEMRGNADYQDFYIVSKEQTQQQIDNAGLHGLTRPLRHSRPTRRRKPVGLRRPSCLAGKIIAMIQPYLEERWQQDSVTS